MIDIQNRQHLDIPAFPQKVAAQASLTTPVNLRQWIFRGYLDGINEGLEEVERLALARKQLTYRNVLTVSVAACLTRSNVGVLEAFAAAKSWAVEGSKELKAADLFYEPTRTFLIYHKRESAKVVQFDPEERYPELAKQLFLHEYLNLNATTVVDLNSVVRYAADVCANFICAD